MTERQEDEVISRTLVCSAVDLATPLRFLEEQEGTTVEVDGPRDDWRSVSVALAGGSSRLTSLVDDRDEKHRRISLGLYNWCRMMEGAAEGVQAPLAVASLNAPLLIGVVADPGPSGDDTPLGLVHLVAVHLHALIFDGSSLRDATGLVLLDDEGESEAALSPDDLVRFDVPVR